MSSSPRNIYECRGAKEAEIEEIVRVTQSAFGVPRTGDFASALRYRLETFEDDRVVFHITPDGPKMVGSCPIFRYPLHFGPVTMMSGGIFMFGVRKEYQRKGVGQVLLEDCNTYLAKLGFELNMLFTGSPDFYRHKGYEMAGLKPKYVLTPEQISAIPVEKMDPIEIRNLTKADLPEICELYETYNQNRPLSRIRTLEYWTHTNTRNSAGFERDIHCVRRNGKLIAYYWGHSHEKTTEIIETAFDPALSEEEKDTICRFLFKREATSGRGIEIRLFPSFEMTRVAIALGAKDLTAYWSGLMFVILDLPVFCHKYLQYHQTCVMPKIPSESITELPDRQCILQIEDQQIYIRKSGQHITLELNPKSVVGSNIERVPISRKNFSILTMGNFSPEELVESEYWTCPEQFLPLFQVLFPHMEAQVYPLDGF